MSDDLRRFLSRHYPRSVPTGPIVLDDQAASDRPEHFCSMLAYLESEQTLRLSLRNCPVNPEIEDVIRSKEGTIDRLGVRADVEINLSVQDWRFVRKLAQVLADMVAPGKRYPDANWVWVYPRTARSLRVFASHLEVYASN